MQHRGSRINFNDDIELYASRTTLQHLSTPTKSFTPKQTKKLTDVVVSPEMKQKLINGNSQPNKPSSSDCSLTVTVTQY